MKKYILRLKDEHQEDVFNGTGYKIAETLPHIWLSIKNDDDYSYYQMKDSATVLTMEDIDGLPYGFINKHRIFEIKEKMYRCELRNNNKSSEKIYCLRRNVDGNIRIAKLNYQTFINSDYCKLTEKEIRSVDDVYMKMAEEIK